MGQNMVEKEISTEYDLCTFLVSFFLSIIEHNLSHMDQMENIFTYLIGHDHAQS